MLCAESYSNLRNGGKTSLILQLSQDSEACPGIPPQLVFYLNCCQNINIQMIYNEIIKMKKISFQPADKAKIKFKWTFFFLFGETWLVSSMKTPK